MSEPKTILHLCEHFGGAEASLHGVARSFQWWIPLFDKEKYRILLCSRKGKDKAYDEMLASGLEPMTLGYHKFDFRNYFALLALLRKEKVDLIHAHGFGASMWGRMAGFQLKIPVIVHGRCNYGTVPFFQRPVERILGPHTKCALAVSESTRDFTIRKRFIPAERVQVLYNGIVLDHIVPLSKEKIAYLREKEFEVSPGRVVLGVVGRLESHKGHLDVFNALDLLKDLPVELWVIGDGAYAAQLQQAISEKQLSDRVRMLGFRRDILSCIQCLDIQIFPSHKEGTPNTLYEALAVGNPIVASTADGQGEILEDGKTAELFEPGDCKKMAESIRKLVTNPELRRMRSEVARMRGIDFDGRKMIRKMENIYDSVLAESIPVKAP